MSAVAADRNGELPMRISPKSITRFASRRSPISIQSDQPFRLMSITGSRTRTRGYSVGVSGVGKRRNEPPVRVSRWA